MVSKSALKTLGQILLAVFISAFLAAPAAAEEKKEVILSTIRPDQNHEILGLVSYRSSKLDPEKICKELTKKASKMGADSVTGIRFYSHAGYLYGTGTAIRFKNE